jgi:hypothetical protein
VCAAGQPGGELLLESELQPRQRPSDCCITIPDVVPATVGELHVDWHNCFGNVGTAASPPPPGRGQRWFAFHRQPNFSDGEFHDVGIALGKGMRIDPGRYAGVRTLLADPFNRAGVFSDRTDPLAPVRFLHLRSDQLAQFKTPTLREVAGSAPYMHDGRFGSLEAVVRFYSTRAGATPFGHPVNLLRPLDLNDSEVADLVAFLESLSGRPLARSSTERLDVPAHE